MTTMDENASSFLVKRFFQGKYETNILTQMTTGRISPNETTLAFDGLPKVEINLNFDIFLKIFKFCLFVYITTAINMAINVMFRF